MAALGFIASIIFYFISYYLEHSGVSLVLSLVLLVATIYIFVLSIIRSKPSPQSPLATSQPSPPPQTSTPQPSPPPQTASPPKTEATEEIAAPAQSSPPPPQSSTPLCPTCGQPLVFLEDSKKWYCQNEKKMVTSPSQIIEKELEAERRELRKELDILDKHLSEGKVSKKVYRELKHKYKSRLKEIE